MSSNSWLVPLIAAIALGVAARLLLRNTALQRTQADSIQPVVGRDMRAEKRKWSPVRRGKSGHVIHHA